MTSLIVLIFITRAHLDTSYDGATLPKLNFTYSSFIFKVCELIEIGACQPKVLVFYQ